MRSALKGRRDTSRVPKFSFKFGIPSCLLDPPAALEPLLCLMAEQRLDKHTSTPSCRRSHG